MITYGPLAAHVDGLLIARTMEFERRLGHKLCLRADEDVYKEAAGKQDGFTLSLAQDTFYQDGARNWDQRVSLRGQGQATRWNFKLAAGVFGITIKASNVIFERMCFTNLDSSLLCGAIRVLSASNIIIRDCDFVDFGVGVSFQSCINFEVSNCRFYGRSGIQIGATTSQQGRITNNHINAGLANPAIYLDPTSTYNLVVANNVATGEIRYTNSAGNGNVGDLTSNVAGVLTVL